MDENGKKRTKPICRRDWVLILILLAIVVVAAVAILAVRRNSIRTRLAAIREAGYPTSFAEMEEYNRLPEGVENAAYLYVKAFNIFARPSDVNVPIFPEGAELPARGEPLPEAMAKAISEYLKENRDCLALLRKGAGIEYCLYREDYLAGIATHLQEARECSKLVELAAILCGDQGDTDAVVGYINDGLRLADSLVRKPYLISYLARIGCIGLFLSGLERTLSATAFSDGQLRRLDDMLSRTEESLDMTDALATDRAGVIEIFQDPSLLPEMEDITRWMRMPLIGRTGLIDYLDYTADCMQALELSGMQRIMRLHEIVNFRTFISCSSRVGESLD